MWSIERGVLSAENIRTRCMRGVLRLPDRRHGQSTVEYALVGALVVIAAAGALTLLGGELNTVFTNISHTLQTASTGH